MTSPIHFIASLTFPIHLIFKAAQISERRVAGNGLFRNFTLDFADLSQSHKDFHIGLITLL